MDAIFGISQIQSVAEALWREGKKYPVWAFHAPMGSGKTTFIHALCSVLGVKTTVNSPTFAIINEYSSADVGAIHHMDWYRLKDNREAIDAGVEDIIMSGEICFIEWPEKAPSILPENTFHLAIEILNEQTRRIYTFKPAG